MRSAAEAAPSFLYLPALRTLGERFTLEGEEARYLTRVVRARENERVTASDGSGHVAVLRVERARPELVLVLESAREHPRPPSARLICGAPEGERGDWLVEKLAELGVTDLDPVDTERVRSRTRTALQRPACRWPRTRWWPPSGPHRGSRSPNARRCGEVGSNPFAWPRTASGRRRRR